MGTVRRLPTFCEQCDSYLYLSTTFDHRPHLRTDPGTLMGLSLESRLMFCRCDARGQQCEQSDRTSSYRKGGSLKCSLFIVQIRHENENKSAEARIERRNSSA